MERFEDTHDVAGIVLIKIAGRFICQQDGRAVDYGACDAQTLLFAAGQCNWAGFFALEQAHLV